MNTEKVIKRDQKYIMHTYARSPLVLEHGEGMYAYDADGKAYLDFTSGIGVNALGYCHPAWVQAVTMQATRLQHSSNLYYTAPCGKLAKRLCARTGLDQVFFGNSGAEANEGAIKCARKYSVTTYGPDRNKVLTLVNSFHGRTLATLTATGQDVFHKDFGPFPANFGYIPANDFDTFKAAVDDSVCAVMMEMVQGEGGVVALDADYVQSVADYCHAHDILIIVDEVQTGVGRTGTFLACEQFGLKPDLVTLAKGLGGGLPIGAMLASKKVADTMGPGSHGSTFGGNPGVCAGGCAVLDAMDDVFMQCSQTKGFCGVTIAMLVEEGKIKLDAPVSKYLPEFKTLWVQKSNKNGVKTLVKAKTPLTIRMVMNHTGGFPFEISAKQGNIKGGGWSGGAPLRQTAAIAAASPLLFEPGTKVQYSNTGIDIGAAIVEVVTGQRWEDFLKERVLLPLGMTSTWFWPTDEQLETQVEMYDCVKDAPAKYRLQNNMQQRPYNDSHVFASAGAGLWTTANDQLKFYKMLMNLGVGDNGVRILKEDTVKNLLAKSTRPKGMGGYSLGLSAPEVDKEDSWFGHGGAWGTNCMVNWHRKELKLWVVQLCGQPRPWDKARGEAEKKFFQYVIDNSGADAYTGRVK